MQRKPITIKLKVAVVKEDIKRHSGWQLQIVKSFPQNIKTYCYCFMYISKLWAPFVKVAISPTHYFLYWRKPTQINFETQIGTLMQQPVFYFKLNLKHGARETKKCIELFGPLTIKGRGNPVSKECNEWNITFTVSVKLHLLNSFIFFLFNTWLLFLFRDLLHMGVTLAGHQRKILSTIQTMTFRNKSTTTVTF